LHHPEVVFSLVDNCFKTIDPDVQRARVEAYTKEARVNITELIPAFKARGGSVIVGPTYAEFVANPNMFTLIVTDADIVITACHEGINRSQMSALVSEEGMRRAFGTSVGRAGFPHGAENGFDPHIAYKDINEDNWYGYIYGGILPRSDPGEWQHEVFYTAFGVEKAERLGQSLVGDLNLNPEVFDDVTFASCGVARTEMRRRFDENIYSPTKLREALAQLSDNTTGKVIFLCFCRAAAIIMARLIENAGDVGLERICIVALPWPDMISSAGSTDDLANYRARTGKSITSFEFNKERQIEQFQLYSNLFVFANKTTGKITATKDKLVATSSVTTAKLLRLLGITM
jgi:hypothetical protein